MYKINKETKELCEWAMRNQVQTIGKPAAITKEEL